MIFLSFDNPNTPEGVDDSLSNPMPSPMESIIAMFLMSMTSFSDYYSAFERTDHEIEAKVKKKIIFYWRISTITVVFHDSSQTPLYVERLNIFSIKS